VSTYVVGIDGSTASRAALDWAVPRAVADDVPVRLVHVIDDEAGMLGEDYRRQAEQGGLQILSAAALEAREKYPSARITSSSVHGTVPWDLSHDAGPQDVLVIGTHRGTSARDHVLGSRSVQIASITPATLVVVPAAPHFATGPVVVGVGLREPDGPAVVRGAHEAGRAGLPLVLVVATGGTERVPERGKLARARLTEAENTAREIAAGVEIATHLSTDEPSRALLNSGFSASLVVLGPSRTFGMGVSPIGTVTQSVLLNTYCPVLITRFTEGL
jgi:nucleotide-binding universal stress UspA family protein